MNNHVPLSAMVKSKLKTTAIACLYEVLKTGGTCTMTDLSKAADVSTAAVTGCVDSLVQRKLVERVTVRDDRRKTILELTDLGKSMADFLFPFHTSPEPQSTEEE